MAGVMLAFLLTAVCLRIARRPERRQQIGPLGSRRRYPRLVTMRKEHHLGLSMPSLVRHRLGHLRFAQHIERRPRLRPELGAVGQWLLKRPARGDDHVKPGIVLFFYKGKPPT